jgi:iron complex transport system ATP-binding protein
MGEVRGMVEVVDIRFRHRDGDEPVLNGISFSSLPGQVTAVLGPNGSGKSTLFKCIAKIWDFDGGDVLISGRSVKDMGHRDVARKVSFVLQDHEPLFPYTVFEVVLMGRAPHLGIFSQPSRRDIEVAEKAMDLLGIHRLADRPYTKISGGERQLVLIARSIAQEAPVMLLDEPTSHLDFRNQVEVMGKVRDIARREGLTVLVTLHDPNMAILFSDKVVMMDKGRLIGEGRADEVITEERIKKVYGLDVALISYNGVKMLCPKI